MYSPSSRVLTEFDRGISFFFNIRLVFTLHLLIVKLIIVIFLVFFILSSKLLILPLDARVTLSEQVSENSLHNMVPISGLIRGLHRLQERLQNDLQIVCRQLLLCCLGKLFQKHIGYVKFESNICFGKGTKNQVFLEYIHD